MKKFEKARVNRVPKEKETNNEILNSMHKTNLRIQAYPLKLKGIFTTEYDQYKLDAWMYNENFRKVKQESN